MKNYFIIVIAIIIFGTACQKPLEIDYPEQEPALVVNCLFSPDTIFIVKITKTQTTSDSTSNQITDATCEMWENNQLLEKLENNNTNIYQSTILPEIGKTYTIKVTHKDYKNVSATSCVPELPQIENLNITNWYVAIDFFWEQQLSDCQLTIIDNKNSTDYYKLNFHTESDCSFFRSNDIVLISEELFEYDPSFLYFSDKKINGQKYNLNFLIPHGIEEPNSDLEIITIAKSLSKEHYLYTKKMLKYSYENRVSELSEAIEPVTMYSNIENGYGIFAGYSQQIDTTILRTPPIK